MAPDPVVEDEDYASSEDSDFAPDAVADHASSADEDEEGDAGDDDTTTAEATNKRKREKQVDVEADDAGFENSGDEAIIGKGKKRRRKDKDRGSDDEGGAAGFVKTRSQRANEKAERRTATVRGPVTVDIDALWAQMTVNPAQQRKQEQQQLASLATAAFAAAGGAEQEPAEDKEEASADKDDNSDMIKIKRTYNFAGKVHTEEKLVARDSAEAKLYLAEREREEKGENEGAEQNDVPEKPPPRKAFRSAFEPIDPSLSGRSDLDLGLKGRLQARERAAQAAKKLNTVEKSRMDWAGFVDKEGIQEELALAGKAKGSFAERQQFLARSDALREEEARRARLATASAAAMGKV